MIGWQCHEPVSGSVCVGCDALQPPPAENDPYVALGIQRRFHIDDQTIDDAWRAVSRKVHPDRWVGKSAVYRRMSLQWTALINEARRILKNPLSRARYLATGNPQAPERGGPQPDSEFLEQIFDLQMMQASDPDAARTTILTMWDTHRAQLDEDFRQWESEQGSLDGVEMLLAKLQYLNTARSQIDT